MPNNTSKQSPRAAQEALMDQKIAGYQQFVQSLEAFLQTYDRAHRRP